MLQIMIDNMRNKLLAEEEIKNVPRADQNMANSFFDRTIEQAILLALKGIRFGSVEIIIHDSKVVQIERKEKTRFDSTLSRPIR